MKKMLLYFTLLCVGGCSGELQSVGESLADPNTISAVGETLGTVGTATANPLLLAVGTIVGGLALILKVSKKKGK